MMVQDMRSRKQQIVPNVDDKNNTDLTQTKEDVRSGNIVVVYKYRIYPNKKTEAELTTILGAFCMLYNWAWLRRHQQYQQTKTKSNRYDDQRNLVEYKRVIPDLSKAPAISVAQVFRRLDEAYRKFYRKECRYPRGKEMFGEYNSFYISAPHNKQFKIVNSKIFLSKIGYVKIRLHRPPLGKHKSLIVKREGNRWYVCIYAEKDGQPQFEKTRKEAGLAIGLNDIVTTSSGEKFENPRFYRRAKKHLSKLQRKMARQREGSHNWRKTKSRWDKVMQKTVNQRNNFLHRLSKQLVSDYDLLAVQKPNLKKFMKGEGRYTYYDTGIAELLWCLSYKSKWYGKNFVEIDEPWRLRDCSFCSEGGKVINVDDNTVICPRCGRSMDKKVNIAKNILAGALYKVRTSP